MSIMEGLIQNAIEALEELKEDTNLPKNVKIKIVKIIIDLQARGNSNLEINKVLSQLEEISEDMNLQAYTRTQLFNIVSILEGV